MNTRLKYFTYLTLLLTVTTTILAGQSYKDTYQPHVVSAATPQPEFIKLATSNIEGMIEIQEKKQAELDRQLNELRIQEEKRKIAEEKKSRFNNKVEYIVNVESLNVRERPYKESNVKDILLYGETVKVNSTHTLNSNWVQLVGGGYINKNYIEKYTEAFKQDTNTTLISASANYGSGPIQNPIHVGIQTKSGLSSAEVEQVLGSAEFKNIGPAVLEVERKYNINAFFIIAIAKLESGNGTSRIATNKNNLFGMNAVDGNAYAKAFTYSTQSESVRDFGRVIHHYYLTKGKTSMSSINKRYSSSDQWAGKVNDIIYGDINKINRR